MSNVSSGQNSTQDTRIKPSWWKRGLFFISLRPYGGSLLTRSDGSYLIGMTIVMFLAALCEGLAWGYLGSTFSVEHPLAAWISAGLFVFLLMWMFDRSLLISDFLESAHKKEARKSFFSGFFDFIVIYKFFVFRVFIVLLSIYITAPYMTQIAFKSDIENGIKNRYQQEVNVYKNNRLAELNAEINILKNQSIAMQNGIDKERTNPLHRGDGPVAKAMNADKAKLDEKIKEKEDGRDNTVKKIEDAVASSNYKNLRGLGIRIDEDSPIFRNEIVQKLEGKSAFWQTENSIRAFLVILAVILLSMKLKQPKTLKLYYSSRLQEKWNLYCLGAYDADLHNSQRSGLLKQSFDALPEEFSCIMDEYSQNKSIRDKRDADEKADINRKRTQAETEAETDRLRLKTEAEVLRDQDKDAAVLAQQKQDEINAREEYEAEVIRQAENLYLANIAKTQEIYDRNKKSFEYSLSSRLSGLSRLQNMEDSHFNRHDDELNALKQEEDDLLKIFTKMQKDYRNQEQKIENSQLSIMKNERELADLNLLLEQSSTSDDLHKAHVVKQVIFYGHAIRRKEDYIRGKKDRLRDFEATQQLFKENCDQVNKDLEHIRQKRREILAPLDEIIAQRSQVEKDCVRLTGEHALKDSPYQPYDDAELPFLVEKLRQQENPVSQANLLLTHELPESNLT